MITARAIAIDEQFLSQETIRSVIQDGLGSQFVNKRVLVLIPDHTRSIPLPSLFRMLVEALSSTKQLDFMVALGTHPPLSTERLYQLVGITAAERRTVFKDIGLFNHDWSDPTSLISIGRIPKDQIVEIAGKYWHPSMPAEIDVRVNKSIEKYNHIIILGPTFPHEVAGFSGGAKYLFPGISGPGMIHATHWLGALVGIVETIGLMHTPVRKIIHTAAEKLGIPLTLISVVVQNDGLKGLFVGDIYEAWEESAELSGKLHIRWYEKPFRRALSCAPRMYDELWTAGKAVYKLEPVMENGGEIIVYAPHLDKVSYTHGKFIYEIGYHILDYFLENWDQFKHLPLGVLAHSTHVRGAGVMENGIEKPNLRIVLASKISPEDCARLNLGYMDPASIDVDDWKEREDEGILYVPKAGEILFRAKGLSQ